MCVSVCLLSKAMCVFSQGVWACLLDAPHAALRGAKCVFSRVCICAVFANNLVQFNACHSVQFRAVHCWQNSTNMQ